MSHCLITGAAGYVGQKLLAALSARKMFERIVALDVRPPQNLPPGVSFLQKDIRDRDLLPLLRPYRLACAVHLAFVVNPIHNEKKMYDINVNGTLNLLGACAELGVPHLILASSASAYGARPDNPPFMSEEHPIRPFRSFSYAWHKGLIEEYLRDYVKAHPEMTVSVIRPCIIYGPHVDNYLSRYWRKMPLVPLINGLDPPFQFVHEDDVVNFILALLKKKRAGAFNVAPDDTVSYSEVARMMGKRTMRLPFALVYLLVFLLWHFRYLEMPPGALFYFTMYPWTVDNRRGKEEVGYRYRYSTRETAAVLVSKLRRK